MITSLGRLPSRARRGGVEFPSLQDVEVGEAAHRAQRAPRVLPPHGLRVQNKARPYGHELARGLDDLRVGRAEVPDEQEDEGDADIPERRARQNRGERVSEPRDLRVHRSRAGVGGLALETLFDVKRVVRRALQKPETLHRLPQLARDAHRAYRERRTDRVGVEHHLGVRRRLRDVEQPPLFEVRRERIQKQSRDDQTDAPRVERRTRVDVSHREQRDAHH
mmetsp:Transcript_4940/g.19792  ORF Transcript_4940/g.19792 Transcript_4940/m.19792 type:complete len:221 (-) Transcript_4940:894-1556(-)